MLGGSDGEASTVTCIACAAEVERSAAREYDKHGDRFERTGKRFEYLCKPCHRALCHQPREGLEAALEAAAAGDQTPAEYAAAYLDAAADGTAPDAGERDR